MCKHHKTSILAGCGLGAVALFTGLATTIPARPVVAQVNPTPGIVGTPVGARVLLVPRPWDTNHVVTAVRYLLDGNTLAEVAAPGRFLWNTDKLRPGRHVIQIQAFSENKFVGVSEPVAVYVTTSLSMATVDVPFFTYDYDPRRASEILPPRSENLLGVKNHVAQIDTAGSPVAERLGLASVEVYLNGVRQEFAPAARVASAEELSPTKAAPKSRRSGKSRRARTAAAKT
ncbi:MAG TPA: hypothetical protein VF719_13105, partial [Abditibacteriaceae bacterium]